MKWNLRTAGIAAILLLTPISTTSSVLASSAPMTENLDSLGSAESNDIQSTGLSAEAHAVDRNESGSLLSVTWSLENRGEQEAQLSWLAGNSYMYDLAISYSGVTIRSSDDNKRYHPLMDSDGDCLCSGNTSTEAKSFIRPGEKVAYWSLFSIPKNVDSIDLEIPGFDPIEGIPIS